MNLIKILVTTILALASAAAFAVVDVNKANQAELESIKGIGPSLSTKILKQRQSGAFKNWADMVERVPGIGDGNAARLSQGGLTVAGASFSPALNSAKAAQASKVDKSAPKAVKPAAPATR